ncbi:flagellar basal body P-ring formation protein FlgA [Maribius pontilimi]|uniref:Flagella basal body P-ring formation protein FlgA n=1 Tax=Palleronia pontilimi TaxID=1964209 RepID=A0A934IGW5_9RHOB|nr:flagellar basal body P-ring formation chaperone FlgA [Palleronia pontilimi]MBJ3763180.1 flagellar basal body P-ring formation protein FlgA [Palleronia pontilimi]
MTRLCLILIALACPAAADTLVAAQTIRAKTVLGPSDLALVPGQVTGGLSDPAQVVGLEARVTLYAGRPIRPGDIGPPALIERNQTVVLSYATGAIAIHTDGRALERAGMGDRVRAMNLHSRKTILGTVIANGRIRVEGGPE